jgi:DNA-binding MarR family transcriptional regulator
MVWFQLASSPRREEYVKEELGSKKNAAKVYMVLSDGPKSQDQVIRATKMSRANVSRLLSYLEEHHFIEKHRNPKDRKQLVFAWTEAERILDISKVASKLLKSKKK